MGAVPGNVIDVISKAMPGKGFRRRIPINPFDFKTSAGLTLTASTDPEILAVSNHLVVSVQEDSDAAPALVLTIPHDYSSQDDLTLKLVVALAGASSASHTLTLSGTRERVGAAQASLTAPAAVSISSTTSALVSFDISAAAALSPGDFLTVLLTPNANATRDVDVLIYGGYWQYSGNLALTVDTERFTA